MRFWIGFRAENLIWFRGDILDGRTNRNDWVI